MTYHNTAAALADPATAVVERAPLTRAFEIVDLAVENRNTIPILGNARLQGDGSALFVTATDLDLELTVAIPAAADSRFALTLPSRKLRDLLKKATASDFVAFTDSDDGFATVDFERVNYRLQSLPVSDFPDINAGTFSHEFALPGAVLWEAIDSTMAAISTEETRYYLNGIFMHAGEPDALSFVATDGHRLYKKNTARPDGSEGMPGIIIPRKTIATMHKLLKGKACPETVGIEVSAQKVRITWAGDGLHVTITSKLVDGTFPDYQRVIPNDEWNRENGLAKAATFDVESMLEGIRAVSLISSERGRAVKLAMSADSVALVVNNPDAGSARADVPAAFDGPDGFEIGYNAAYLTDAIATASPDGAAITWRGSDAGAPAIFTGSRAGWLAVLMPMRV